MAMCGGSTKSWPRIFYARTPTGRSSTRTNSSQTDRPVTISGLSVHEVRVRILGDVAIIHARTSYTTADGDQRNGRYTDVWARRDGKWLAVSAHVTR
jgi:ketosteroid isomerase-like protein